MITFSKAKPEEAQEVKKLLYETWISSYSNVYPLEAIQVVTTEWHSITLLTEQIQNPKAFFWVAKDKGKIIAMCNATFSKERIYIQRLHVVPSYQRQGIGSKFMTKVEKNYSKATKVDLEVEKNNDRAIAFYKKLGFKELREKIFTVKTIRIPSIVMEKMI